MKTKSALKRQIFHLAEQDREALIFIREELQLPSDALAVRTGIRELNRRLKETQMGDMTKKPIITKGIKKCPKCGADLGSIVEIEQEGILIQVLQAGNQFFLDERAMCSVCLQPVYWNVNIKNMDKLVEMNLGQVIESPSVDEGEESNVEND